MNHTRRGFTLIELLVVVLIIGILAAVALPQYQKAVEKSRVSEALMNLKALQQAADVYILQNGSISGLDMSVLDIQVPAETKTFQYAVTAADSLISATRIGTGYVLSLTYNASTRTWTKSCSAGTTDVGSYVCTYLQQGYGYTAGS